MERKGCHWNLTMFTRPWRPGGWGWEGRLAVGTDCESGSDCELVLGLREVSALWNWPHSRFAIAMFHCIQPIIIFCSSDLLGYCRSWHVVAYKLKMWSAELNNRPIPVLTRVRDGPGESGLPYPHLGLGTCVPEAFGFSSSSLSCWSGPVSLSGSGCGVKSCRSQNHLGASWASLWDSTNWAL